MRDLEALIESVARRTVGEAINARDLQAVRSEIEAAQKAVSSLNREVSALGSSISYRFDQASRDAKTNVLQVHERLGQLETVLNRINDDLRSEIRDVAAIGRSQATDQGHEIATHLETTSARTIEFTLMKTSTILNTLAEFRADAHELGRKQRLSSLRWMIPMALLLLADLGFWVKATFWP